VGGKAAGGVSDRRGENQVAGGEQSVDLRDPTDDRAEAFMHDGRMHLDGRRASQGDPRDVELATHAFHAASPKCLPGDATSERAEAANDRRRASTGIRRGGSDNWAKRVPATIRIL
jgi:hypothetical protein